MENSYQFLSQVYDKLMYDVDYDAYSDYIAQLLGQEGIEQGVLYEAACGTGNLSFRLSKRGYQVYAFDKSPHMLEIAQQKARENGQRILFGQQDMAHIEFARRADAVVCGIDGVNYLSQLGQAKAFFEGAYSILKPRGMLIFDISSHYKLTEVLADQFFYEDGEDITYFWNNSWDREAMEVTMEITLFVRQQDGRYVRRDEAHIQRAYESQELKQMLKEAGFAGIRAYGYLSDNAPEPQEMRIVFVAIKKAE